MKVSIFDGLTLGGRPNQPGYFLNVYAEIGNPHWLARLLIGVLHLIVTAQKTPPLFPADSLI